MTEIPPTGTNPGDPYAAAAAPQPPPPAAPPPGYGSQPAYGAPPSYGAPGYGAPQGYAAPGYPQATGQLGMVRSIGTCILLAIVTLGIYTFVWVWKTHDEMKAHTGNGLGGPVGFLIYFVISPVTYFLLPNEVEKMLQRAGRPSRVSAMTGFWILLPIAGPIVWFVKVQGQLNEYWRSLGATG
jgi:hypothetical protein